MVDLGLRELAALRIWPGESAGVKPKLVLMAAEEGIGFYWE